MRPTGLLMIEHRLIERMVEVIRREAERMESDDQLRPATIDAMVDFARTYADRTHHGKEEQILFRELAKRNMSPEDRQVMNQLIQDHQFSRRTTGELCDSVRESLQGQPGGLARVVEKMKALVQMYPQHIATEDRSFFPAAMRYFCKEEQQAMIEEFWRFDREMIHDKYESVVEQLEISKP